MFDRFKKKPEPEEPKAAEATEEPEVTEKPQAAEKPRAKAKRTKKPAEEKPATVPEENIPKIPQVPTGVKPKEKPFIGIKEYRSVSEIAESIDHELAETKSALGGYLRQLDDRRSVAEKSKKLYDVVSKIADKKPSKDAADKVNINGLEIVLDATALNELSEIENVVKSHQQRLIALQKAREALKTLDDAGDTEGIRYMALEKEGIPEQILLKLS